MLQAQQHYKNWLKKLYFFFLFAPFLIFFIHFNSTDSTTQQQPPPPPDRKKNFSPITLREREKRCFERIKNFQIADKMTMKIFIYIIYDFSASASNIISQNIFFVNNFKILIINQTNNVSSFCAKLKETWIRFFFLIKK